MKSLQLTQSQLERVAKAKKGETIMFIFPFNWEYKSNIQYMKKLIEARSPIKKGDKDIFIQEDFRLYTETQIDYKADTPNINLDWEDASKMTKEQSRYTISECVDVKVVRVQDSIYDNSRMLPSLDIGIIKKLGVKYHVPKSYMGHLENAKDGFINYYNNQLEEQNISRIYEDNDYVFLLEVKR